MREVVEILEKLGVSLGKAVSLTWWLALPLVLALVARDLWLRYVRALTISKTEWLTLKIEIPEIVDKTPKAMEQVFASVYSIYSFGANNKFLKKYWDGKIDRWISFEIVGNQGAINFFIRTPKDYRNLLESAIYSQFPAAEINQVDDYLLSLPRVLPNEAFDIWAAELGLARDNPYPIKTYPLFEEEKDERRVDPVAAIAEVMSNLKESEYLLIQKVISPAGKPTGQDIQKQGKEVVEELLGKKKKEEPKGLGTWISAWAEFFTNLLLAPFREPVWTQPGAEEKKEDNRDFTKVSEGTKEAVKMVESKIGKPIFEASIRVIYIDRRESFSPLNVAATMGYFSQYNTPALNAFKPTVASYDKIWGRLFPIWKNYMTNKRKRDVFNRFKKRQLGMTNHITNEKLPLFSTEEMATLYHFPITGVEAPGIRRLQSKKGEPPAGLPIK